jgi:hypothetical protein
LKNSGFDGERTHTRPAKLDEGLIPACPGGIEPSIAPNMTVKTHFLPSPLATPAAATTLDIFIAAERTESAST